jgi:hypothetical protein
MNVAINMVDAVAAAAADVAIARKPQRRCALCIGIDAFNHSPHDHIEDGVTYRCDGTTIDG